jgi:hypothetical protein
VRRAFATPGGARSFQIAFRQSVVPGLAVNATLHYDLTPNPPRG